MGFSQNLKTLIDCLSYLSQAESDKLYDFSRTKANYYAATGKTKLNELKKEVLAIPADHSEMQKISQLLQLLARADDLYEQKNIPEIKKIVDKIAEVYASLDIKVAKSKKLLSEAPDFPASIQDELKADFDELQRCFDSRCFRASIILCGRILEVALHYLYFKKTNNDLLETAPGVGLGKIVAKLVETGIDLGPGINEQIHLINKVRVRSVHKSKEVFAPSKEQTHAMILYTIDILNKIFQN